MLTLIEASKLSANAGDLYTATIMELYAKNSEPLRVLPLKNIPGNTYKFNREDELPDVDFRGVNEAWNESTGEVGTMVDTLAIGGGDLDVDKFITATEGMGTRAAQIQMKVKALSLYITKTIIKGDVASNKRSFNGLQVRMTGDQIIKNSTAASGAGLSLKKLDELIDQVDEPTHLFMNKGMRRILTEAARLYTVGGYITYTKDEFGRRVTQYNDLPIIIVDKDNKNMDILPWTEAADSGSSVCASIYCISTSANGVALLQNGDMQVTDLGEIDAEPKYRTRVEWYVGLTVQRELSAARLKNIQNTTPVS